MVGTVDYVDKSRLQWSTTDQKSIYIGDLNQFVTILLIYTAPINNADSLTFLYVGLEPFSNPCVDLVNLLGCCRFACAYRPNWFIS